MLSSTSSSNERVPPLSYARLWLTAAGLALLLLGAWEGFWRAHGFAPTPNDDVGWWARARAEADLAGPETVVLVGSSRMQLGFDPKVFTATTGRKTLQLAIDGDTGIEVLQDLADDPSFHGTVVYELTEKYLLGIGAPTARTAPTVGGEWLREYHASNIFSRFEWRARALAQTSFAFLLPDLSTQNLAASLRKGTLPPTPYVKINIDRSKQADYQLADLATVRERHEAVVLDEYARLPSILPDEFVRRGRWLSAWAAQIEARGGRVIFVRFPTSGTIRELEASRFPKPIYWDALVAQDRLTAVHFADYDTLKSFICGDGTHLDYRDAAKFTAALAQIILQKNLLPAAGH